MSDCKHPVHPSWLLNVVERASVAEGWAGPRRAATIALLGLGAWLATLLALAFTTGPASVLTLLCLGVVVVAAGADRIIGSRQGGAR